MIDEQERYDEAVLHYTTACKAKPELTKAQDGLKEAMEKLSQDIDLQEKALKTNPDQPQLHMNLGRLYWEQKNYEKALYHWEKLIELDPDQPYVLNNAARMKAVFVKESFYDPSEALKLAQKACEITNNQEVALLDTLSICYAANDDFEKAVATAQKALALAQEKNQKTAAERIQKRLLLFQAGKVYQEEIN